MKGALFTAVVALWLAPSAPAATPTRLLYASDWNGPTQIFAANPSSSRTVGQLTFEHSTRCRSLSIACGFIEPLPSPDGRKIAYFEAGAETEPAILWIADADGRNPQRIGETANPLVPYHANRTRSAIWSPDSKELAYTSRDGARFVRADGRRAGSGRWWHGWPSYYDSVSPDRRWVATVTDHDVVVTNRRTGRKRKLLDKKVLSLAWSPDSRALAYVEGAIGFSTAATGDLGVVTLAGRDRTLLHERGQIQSVAWTKLPPRTAYRPPEVVNGVFAGGPIARLAADGKRVAYAACLDLFAWTPAAGEVTELGSLHRDPATAPNASFFRGACLAPNQRDEIYDLAVAGDRVAWGEKTSGLVYHWWLMQTRVGPSPPRYELATGSNALGSNWFGAGGLAGSGQGIVYSAWQTAPDPASGFPVTAMTLFRTTEASCPCPAIEYGAARQEFTSGSGLTPVLALDTDGARIAALRYDRLAIYDLSGRQLRAFDVLPAAAQFAGEDIVALVPNELRVYAPDGTLRHSWTMPTDSVGRDCRYYSEPQCRGGSLTLQDATRNLAAYVVQGEVHVLRLADGRNTVVGYGTEARFMNDGLVYADGARIRIVPWNQLE